MGNQYVIYVWNKKLNVTFDYESSHYVPTYLQVVSMHLSSTSFTKNIFYRLFAWATNVRK